MSRKTQADNDNSTDNAKDADECDSLIDKLKGGDYGEMVKVAQKAQDAQQLCVTAAGIKKGDPYSCFARADPYPTAGPTPPPAEDPDEEIKKLRAARMNQMKQNAAFKQQGHGSLRELADEKEFVSIIGPHDRGVIVLEDGSRGATEEVVRAVERLAKRHLETQFCRLHIDKAKFLTYLVEIEAYPTIFLTRKGQVVGSLPPSQLFQHSSASSPLFTKSLGGMLLLVGAITKGEEGSATESEGDRSDDGIDRRRR